MIIELGKASVVTEGLIPGPTPDFFNKAPTVQRNPA